MIHWNEWGKDAFNRAKKEKKPILLDIFGVWCHWCHKMDEDNYENHAIATCITENFIPVRVDTDKRPDINERYNQGGWPTTVFLDHERRILTGVLYVPPEQFLPLLEQVAYQFSLGRKGVMPTTPLAKKPAPLSADIPIQMEQRCLQSFDPSYGGFGEPKFPLPDVLEFLLKRYQLTKRKELLEAVEKTVHGILSGLYDHEEGGFFRYSVTPDWQLPHYEKMLDTNAGMVHVLSLLSTIAPKPQYQDALKGTVHFLRTVLGSPDGGFYASQDADKEEAYYGKSIQERKKLPTPFIDKTIYADLQGIGIRAFQRYLHTNPDRDTEVWLKKTVERVRKELIHHGRVAHYPGAWLDLLRDHVSLGRAIAETGNIKTAQEIVAFIEKTFRSKDTFWDVTGKGEGKLSIRMQNINEHVQMAEFYQLLGEKEKARKTLEVFGTDWDVYGIMAASYATSVQNLTSVSGDIDQ